FEEALEEARLMAPDHTFLLELPSALPILKLDRDRILQVIVNLLDYAQKVSPAEQPLKLVVWTPDYSVLLSVYDYSHGTAEQDRERVFDPFSAEPGASNQPGKGLWLPLARAIIEAHGGRMWLEASKEHAGNSFIIELPVH